MLRVRNTTFGAGSNLSKPDPTILFISRIDALSMFDRRASSALSALPAVSVMISAAAHLLNQPNVKVLTHLHDCIIAFFSVACAHTYLQIEFPIVQRRRTSAVIEICPWCFVFIAYA